jgi:2-polyprenyl-3-methyl-5-hydroxy-6-metoxy-1,4-benzoquinol methylase
MNYERLYDYRFKEVDQARRQAVWREIAAYLYEVLGRPKRVLDPAGGRGEFINGIASEERWMIDAVDQHPRVDPTVTQIVADIFDVELPNNHFDGVFVSNLLEHLTSQELVATLLAKLRQAMVPGGVIAVMGPNFKVCARTYFDCADHTLALTDVSVAEHLYTAGFDIRSVVRRFLPHSFRGQLPASSRLTRAYLKTPIAWHFIGAQFLVVGAAP